MDGLLESISRAIILNAAEKVVYMADMPISHLVKEKTLAKELKVTSPILGPLGLLIKVNTKDKSSMMNSLVNEVMTQLTMSNTIDPQMLRQLHACRLSSFDETIEVFLFSLEDASSEAH